MIAVVLGAIFITAVVGGFWLNYKHLQEENLRLAEDRATATAAFKTQKAEFEKQVKVTEALQTAVQTLQEEQRATNDLLQEMAEASAEASEESRRLRTLFSKHDFERLSHAKPVLIQNRINRASTRIWRMLESATAVGSYYGPGSGEDSGEGGNPPASPTAVEPGEAEVPNDNQ